MGLCLHVPKYWNSESLLFQKLLLVLCPWNEVHSSFGTGGFSRSHFFLVFRMIFFNQRCTCKDKLVLRFSVGNGKPFQNLQSPSSESHLNQTSEKQNKTCIYEYLSQSTLGSLGTTFRNPLCVCVYACVHVLMRLQETFTAIIFTASSCFCLLWEQGLSIYVVQAVFKLTI